MVNERFSSVLQSLKSRPLFFLLLLLAVLALIRALMGWPLLIERVLSPFQVAQTEAVIVQHSLDLLAGRPFLVPARSSGSFLLPPLSLPFYFLQSALMKCLGGLWLAGRLISFGSYLGIIALFFTLAGQGWRKPWVWLVSGSFLLSPTWAFWATIDRSDALVLFLNLLAVVLLLKGTSLFKDGTRGSDGLFMVLAAFANGLAILCKPTALTVTLAVLATLALRKQFRALFIFGIAVTVPVTLVEGAAEVMTRGLWLKTGFGVSGGYDLHLAWYFFSKKFLPEAGWLVGALLFLFVVKKVPLFWKCQLFFSMLSLLLLGNVDGAENYYLEFFMFGSALLVSVLSSEPEDERQDRAWMFALTAFFIFGFYQMTSLAWPQPPSPEVMAMKREALKPYSLPGEHLAMDADLPLMAGKRVWLQADGYKNLVESGQLDPGPLLKMIEAHFFTTIELYDQPQEAFLPDVVEAAIRDNYEVRIREFGRIWLFPRSSDKKKP